MNGFRTTVNNPHATYVRWVAVRCCCNPKKVLGFMRLPEADIEPEMTLSLSDRYGNPHQLVVGTCRDPLVRISDQFMRDGPYDAVRYELELEKREIAIKSEDRPLEFWRAFEQFVELPR